MTTPTQAQIEAACFGVSRVWENEKDVLVSFNRRLADDELRSLHEHIRAAAQVGEPDTAGVDEAMSYFHAENLRIQIAATIERCAQVAENWPETKIEIPTSTQAGIAAAIRKLKDEP